MGGQSRASLTPENRLDGLPLRQFDPSFRLN
jgi:hypothetical protein